MDGSMDEPVVGKYATINTSVYFMRNFASQRKQTTQEETCL